MPNFWVYSSEIKKMKSIYFKSYKAYKDHVKRPGNENRKFKTFVNAMPAEINDSVCRLIIECPFVPD
jgi:hypothetical protein